jgi:glucose dehydrogenase
MSKFSFSKWIIVSLALFMSLSAYSNDGVRELMKDSNYWVFPGGNYNNWRYSELDQINNKNAGDIVAAWTFSTGRLQGHEGGPLVLPPSETGLDVDTLYIHASFPNDVFAINLETLEITWDFVPPQDEAETVPKMCCDIVNRGLGYSMGQIYLQAADTTLYALNPKDGSIVWSTKNGADVTEAQGGPYGPANGMTNTNAPHPIKDKVFTGCSGAEFGVRCWIAAYNAGDGSLAWRAFSMGPDEDILFDENTTSMGEPVGADSSLKTWCAFDAEVGTGKSSWGEMALRANSAAERDCKETSDQWKIGGGSTWGWWPADFDENLMYYGNGNPGTWNPVVRPGDNKWSMSIFARDIDTGMARWVYQMTPHDEWDYDGINEMILAELDINGTMTPSLVHFDRNGFGYTMNRKTGELLVAEKYDPAVNWATHVDMKTGYPQVVNEFSTHYNGQDVTSKDICPAALGTKDQQPAAYSPKTNLFYVPTNHVCMTYEPVSYEAGGVTYEQAAGSWYVNANLTMYPAGQVLGNGTTNMGNFIAWDASEGKIAWSIPERWSVWSGALATNGDVVFYGTLEGYAKAIDASSGKLLWQFKTPSGIIGNFNTWSHKGKQYVGVLSGIGGWAGAVVAIPVLRDMSGDAALGAVGGYRDLWNSSRNSGVLMVFSLP